LRNENNVGGNNHRLSLMEIVIMACRVINGVIGPETARLSRPVHDFRQLWVHGLRSHLGGSTSRTLAA